MTLRQIIPLAKLSLAPENARYGVQYDKDELKALAASIVGLGRLLEPLKVYADGDGFKVWDGGRRLAALQGLAAVKSGAQKLPDALKAGVPCDVEESKEKAGLHSAATFVRADMHPAEEFLAYKALFDQGLDEGEIAAACAVATPRVRQLLRLRGVAPEIIDAFKAGKLPLDVVEAFSITDDHRRQLDALASFTGKDKPSNWQVRERLRKGSLDGGMWVAKFVGVEAYEKAGGTFLVDLFSGGNRDEADWADRELAQKLANEKVQALMNEIKAEGWGEVHFLQPASYSWDRNLDQRPKAEWTAEFKAGASCYLLGEYGGKLKVSKGHIVKGGAGKNAAKPSATAGQVDPARYGYGHTGHAKLTIVATRATQVALVRKPVAAYDALLSHLAWVAFKRGFSDSYGSRLKVDHQHIAYEVATAADKELEAMRKKWDARLPKARIAFCDYVAGLSAKEKAELLAFSFASTLSGLEHRTDARQPTAWAHLGWMASYAGVNMAEVWTPDVAFLKLGSREALAAGLKELGDKPKADAKKGDLAARLAGLSKEKGWVPKLLATFTTAKDPEPRQPGQSPLAETYPEGGSPVADEPLAGEDETPEA